MGRDRRENISVVSGLAASSTQVIVSSGSQPLNILIGWGSSPPYSWGGGNQTLYEVKRWALLLAGAEIRLWWPVI